MPEAIQSTSVVNQSHYDPSEQVSRVPDAMSCGTSAAPASPGTTDGKALLVKKYGSGGEDCTKHLIGAGVSFAVAGTSAAIGIATAPSVVGGAAGMAGTIGGIIKGAADLAAYFNCEDRNDRMQSVADECNAQGGTLLAGAGDSSVVCVVPEQ